MFPSLGGNGGNRGGSGGSGGGGGGGGDFGQPLYDLAAADPPKEEEEESEESEPEPVKAKQDENAWKELVTPSEEVEEVPGQRAGTNRCVEVVIEGWPEVGALPKMVRGGGGFTVYNGIGSIGS